MIDSWICNCEYDSSDNNFWKIFDFFVIKTPVKGTSMRGISFKERNFKKADEVLNKIKKLVGSNFESVNECEDVSEILKMNGIYEHLSEPFEYAVYRVPKELGVTEAFFYCIRCSLAHGAFCIHKYEGIKYYYFENMHKEKHKHKATLNARMIIKESTLLEIIDFCNSKTKSLVAI